jgi:hypothetical protein
MPRFLIERNFAEAIRAAARRAKIPADVVIDVSEVRPEMFAQALGEGDG